MQPSATTTDAPTPAIGAASLADACDSVAELQHAEDEAAALDVLVRTAPLLHADSACFIASVLHAPPARWRHRMLAACDLAWASDYMRLGRYDHDPWLRYARGSLEPIIASELSASHGPQADTVRAAQEAGMRSVWIIPAPPLFDGAWTGALYLASGEEGFYEDNIRLAHRARVLAWALTMQLQQWMRARLRAEILAESRLTATDIELLRHEERGLGSKAIAAALRTQAKTIDCRFQRVNGKLGTASRREAWRIAKVYGVI